MSGLTFPFDLDSASISSRRNSSQTWQSSPLCDPPINAASSSSAMADIQRDEARLAGAAMDSTPSASPNLTASSPDSMQAASSPILGTPFTPMSTVDSEAILAGSSRDKGKRQDVLSLDQDNETLTFNHSSESYFPRIRDAQSSAGASSSAIITRGFQFEPSQAEGHTELESASRPRPAPSALAPIILPGSGPASRLAAAAQRPITHSQSERALPDLAQRAKQRRDGASRSRAGSLALSSMSPPLSSAPSSIREMPSRPSSPAPSTMSRMSSLRGKLKRSGSSFLHRLRDSEAATRTSTEPLSSSSSKPPSEEDEGLSFRKGKTKRVVKRFLVRSQTSTSAALSSEMAVVPSSGPRRSMSVSHLPAATTQAPLSDIGSAKDTTAIAPEAPEPFDYFNHLLPHELQVKIFRTVIDLHVAQHDRDIRLGRFAGSYAKATRWVGEQAGRRELIKISRVCRSWRDLSFDGALWAHADLHPFVNHLSPKNTARILGNASNFVRDLKLQGWSHLSSKVLQCSMLSTSYETRLVKLDLRGCWRLSSHSMASVIRASSLLKEINLKGLRSVNRSIMDAIRLGCPQLEVLNISHCRGLSPLDPDFFGKDGRPSWPSLRSLSAAELAGEGLLERLSWATPALQHLDIAQSRAISDDDIKALVSVPRDEYLGAYRHQEDASDDAVVVFLYATEAGESADGYDCHGLVPRRRTKLRHLRLSHCRSLSDTACKYLAHAVPDLEILELASIGGGLRDDGLVRLLGACRKLRKLDLDGATELTDRTLIALARSKTLTHLGLGFFNLATTEGLLKIVRDCPTIAHLRLDNTAANDLLVKEFIRRQNKQAYLSVVDCRSVSRNVVEALESKTRPRSGWRGWAARPMGYQDGPKPRSGRDECCNLPVLQSFWTWNRVPMAPIARRMSGSYHAASMTELTAEGVCMDDGRSCLIM